MTALRQALHDVVADVHPVDSPERLWRLGQRRRRRQLAVQLVTVAAAAAAVVGTVTVLGASESGSGQLATAGGLPATIQAPAPGAEVVSAGEPFEPLAMVVGGRDADAPGGTPDGVFAVTADGHERALLDLPGFDGHWSFDGRNAALSDDGRRLVWLQEGPPPGYVEGARLRVWEASTGEVRSFDLPDSVNGPASGLDIDPTGTRAAYQADLGAESLQADLVVDLDTGVQQPLSAGGRPLDAWIDPAGWSADGRERIYCTGPFDRCRYWRHDVVTGARTMLPVENHSGTAWLLPAPDGRTVVMEEDAGAMASMQPMNDGGGPRSLVRLEAQQVEPADQLSTRWLTDLETGAQQRLGTFGYDEPWAVVGWLDSETPVFLDATDAQGDAGAGLVTWSTEQRAWSPLVTAADPELMGSGTLLIASDLLPEVD